MASSEEQQGPEPPLDPSRERRRLEQRCPKLSGCRYELHSRSTKRYNCVAWANGDWRRYWSPQEGYYWPIRRDEFAPDIATVDILEEWFRGQGFGDCDTVPAGQPVERVAIYGDVMSALHVARQPPGRGWLSKMGDGPDIEHVEPEWVESPYVGQLQVVLCRAVDEPTKATVMLPSLSAGGD